MAGHGHFGGYDGPCTDLGSGACAHATLHGGAAHITNADGSIAGGPDPHIAGFVIAFDVPWQEWRVEGHVTVDAEHFPDRPHWTMTGSLEGGNLTLQPSVLMSFGNQPDIHGYVTNGKWVPVP